MEGAPRVASRRRGTPCRAPQSRRRPGRTRARNRPPRAGRHQLPQVRRWPRLLLRVPAAHPPRLPRRAARGRRRGARPAFLPQALRLRRVRAGAAPRPARGARKPGRLQRALPGLGGRPAAAVSQALRRAGRTMSGAGKVYLVGAGPGAPDLLTLRAARLIESADVVLHDALVHAEVLALARGRLIDVGKRYGKVSTEQRFIDRVLVAAARSHALVVRLKGGDPMLFG